MPTSARSPGVHVAEVDAPASRAIVPTATAITAFVGRAQMGPVESPTTIYSMQDFVRLFGAADFDYPLTYSVLDFFDHGGAEAIVVRLYEPASDKDGVARISVGNAALSLVAANPGVWGNRLSAAIDSADITDVTAEPFAAYGLKTADLFNLTLTLRDATGTIVATERYLNLSVRQDGAAASFPKRIDRALAQSSLLARVDALPMARPGAATTSVATGGHDGTALTEARYLGDQAVKTGLYALEQVAQFNLLVIPPDRPIATIIAAELRDLPTSVHHAAATYCTDRRALYIVDPPLAWHARFAAHGLTALDRDALQIHGANTAGTDIARNAAIFFPPLWRDCAADGGKPRLFAPGGAIAGIMAATDAARGVWTAAAGSGAQLQGVARLDIALNDTDAGRLNELGINCLRDLPSYGPIVFGARTVRGADQFEDEFKYIPVRRLTLHIEESISTGIRWAVFEPNGEALWSALRLSIGTFMADLASQGAFSDYRVVCDASTTTADDIFNGIVNIMIEFAPTHPTEFIVLTIQQVCAQPPS